MKRVVIESPYRGNNYISLEANKTYLNEAIGHSLSLGEAPFASHALYTDALNDTIAQERLLGMRAGWVWHEVADLVAVYIDLGVSSGMHEGIMQARKLKKDVEIRALDVSGVSNLTINPLFNFEYDIYTLSDWCRFGDGCYVMRAAAKWL